ncbi:MAG: GntR family transcriptional regulator [Massiliimalia sp.]
MNWKFESDRPIYVQLVEQMKLRIIAGTYPPGSKLESVRDLAAQAGVNPNTMQKAMAELERDGLVFTQRTAGRFITEDTDMIQQMKKSFALKEIQEFLQKMQRLGLSKEEIITILESEQEETV